METVEFKVPPVVKTVVFPGPKEDAFDRFTSQIGSWWPLATHSLGGADHAVSVGFEHLDAGGELVERTRSGDRHVWGTIVGVDRPRFISFTWHVGREPDGAQLIEVAFEPHADGTTGVTLTHSGWERLGDKAREARDSYDTGWAPVLARFAETGPR
jgi:uncharacterized protein YndB with AHSA1/START domain